MDSLEVDDSGLGVGADVADVGEGSVEAVGGMRRREIEVPGEKLDWF